MTTKEWMHQRLDEIANDPAVTSRAIRITFTLDGMMSIAEWNAF